MTNPTTINALHDEVLANLTAAPGLTDHQIIADSDMLTVSVPATPRAQATTTIALKPYTTLPMRNIDTRAIYAVFPTHPADTAPYHRTVHFRVTGTDAPDEWAGHRNKHHVLITPGTTTEAHIPELLSELVYGTPTRATDITLIHLT